MGYHLKESHKLWGFVNVASDILNEMDGGIDYFSEMHPTIELYQRNYRDAGQYQISLQALDASSLRSLFENNAVRKAAAALALRVMRKRATIYNKYHCKLLANAIL